MTDMTDFNERQREHERESLGRTLLVAAVPVALIVAALLVHLVMMKIFGA